MYTFCLYILVTRLLVCVCKSVYTYLCVRRGHGPVLVWGHSSSQGFCEVIGFMLKHQTS